MSQIRSMYHKNYKETQFGWLKNVKENKKERLKRKGKMEGKIQEIVVEKV